MRIWDLRERRDNILVQIIQNREPRGVTILADPNARELIGFLKRSSGHLRGWNCVAPRDNSVHVVVWDGRDAIHYNMDKSLNRDFGWVGMHRFWIESEQSNIHSAQNRLGPIWVTGTGLHGTDLGNQLERMPLAESTRVVYLKVPKKANLEVIENPTEQELRSLIGSSLHRIARLIKDPDGNVYAWDATYAIHDDVGRALEKGIDAQASASLHGGRLHIGSESLMGVDWFSTRRAY